MVGRSVSVFIPGLLPSKWLSPNRGERKEGRVPIAISEAKGKMRGEVAVALLADECVKAIDSPLDPAHVVLVLRWFKRTKGTNLYRPEDAGNAIYSLKAAIDGIIDAGLVVDDGYQHVAILSGRIERCDSPEDEGLLIQVTEV